MNDPAREDGAPIRPGEPLDAVLRAARVPPLPGDFAARVLARTAGRPADQAPDHAADHAADGPAELPPLRRAGHRAARWRSGRRLAVGAAVFGALASAAAAAGLFGVLPDRVPSPGELWANIAGPERVAAPPPPPEAAPPRPAATRAPVAIEGPIDTPEELEEVFRRYDDLRARRSEQRREATERRLERALERRREQGLPVPDPAAEARLRERIEAARERREERIGQRLETRREELREKVEAGEAVRPGDILPERGRRAIERLRQLPPDERRERVRQWREGRQQRLEPPPDGS